jgi:hypothetical protein
MSANQKFATKLQQKELAVRECQQIVFGAAELRPGQRVDEQIKSAAKNLGQPFARVRRAWFGLGGPKVLLSLREAWVAFVARQEAKAERELVTLHRRLDRLENTLARNSSQATELDSEPDTRRRLGAAPL